MAYQPESNCNAANYNPNDISSLNEAFLTNRSYDTLGSSNAQAEQKAAYQNQKNADEFWKKQLQGIGQTGLSGAVGHSSIARSSAGRNVLGNNLQDEAAKVRSQSDQLKNLVANLEYALFEPTPIQDCQGKAIEKDNPSTIEGNIQHTSRSLAIAILNFENILAKIGGR